MDKKTIYHITTKKDLRACTKDGNYIPEGFDRDGFIHCTGEPSVTLLVLKDYFTTAAETEEILVLEIDTTLLESEVKFEAPAPLPVADTSHIKEAVLFPHIYGPVNINAVSRAGNAELKIE